MAMPRTPGKQLLDRAISVIIVIAGMAALGMAAAVFVPLAFDLHPFAMTEPVMEPAVKAGALLVTAKVPVPDLKVGDIVVYAPVQERGRVYVRRVETVERTGDGASEVKITTRADRIADPDRYTIDGSQSIGRVVFQVPYVGRLLAFTGRREAFVVLGLVIVAQLVVRSTMRGRR